MRQWCQHCLKYGQGCLWHCWHELRELRVRCYWASGWGSRVLYSAFSCHWSLYRPGLLFWTATSSKTSFSQATGWSVSFTRFWKVQKSWKGEIQLQDIVISSMPSRAAIQKHLQSQLQIWTGYNNLQCSVALCVHVLKTVGDRFTEQEWHFAVS